MEALHVAFELDDPRQRWTVTREPAISPAFAIAELFWMLAGKNEAPVLNYWNRQLPKYAGGGETYPGAYGHRLRTHFGLDQIRGAVECLRANPESRQVVLQLWDATQDLPTRDGRPRSADVPCNVVSLLKVRGGRLHWTQVIRSNDIIRGFPYNVIQFTGLQEILAGWLGVGLGPYFQWSDSLHVYESDLSRFRATDDGRVEPSEDSLGTAVEEGEAMIAELFSRLRGLVRDDLTKTQLEAVVRLDGHLGYQNLLAILGAEAARRRGWFDVMERVEAFNENLALRQLWSRWKMGRASGRAKSARAGS
ncbi:MAG: thymidylate synthase [Chloroflexi bacterium]|nr:thymidylate synthase [Chloroflexota bacterium]